jgi:hypothetical protein
MGALKLDAGDAARKRIQKNLIAFDSAISEKGLEILKKKPFKGRLCFPRFVGEQRPKGWRRALLLFSEIKFTGVWCRSL